MLCCGSLLMSVLSYIACSDITGSGIFCLSCNEIRYKPPFQSRKESFSHESALRACCYWPLPCFRPFFRAAGTGARVLVWHSGTISWAQLGWAGAEVCAQLGLVEPPPWEPWLSWALPPRGRLPGCPGCRDTGALGAGELAPHLPAPAVARKVQLLPPSLVSKACCLQEMQLHLSAF